MALAEQYVPRDGGAPVLAVQVRPDNWAQVADWVRGGVMIASDPENPGNQAVAIGSLDVIASLGQWVVRSEGGDYVVVDPSLFTITYVRND